TCTQHGSSVLTLHVSHDGPDTPLGGESLKNGNRRTRRRRQAKQRTLRHPPSSQRGHRFLTRLDSHTLVRVTSASPVDPAEMRQSTVGETHSTRSRFCAGAISLAVTG